MTATTDQQQASGRAILSRLLLLLGLFLAGLLPELNRAHSADAPQLAGRLLTDPSPAIMPTVAAQRFGALPQQDAPDAALPHETSHAATAAPAMPMLRPRPEAWPVAPAYLRPFPHGPPAV